MTELASGLVARGWKITVVCAQPQLDPSAAPDAPVEPDLPGITIVRLRAIGSHSHSLIARGMFAATFTVRSLLWLLRRRAHYDGILVTTNPPFLGLAPMLARSVTGRAYALLVYDVYPDIAVALGAIARGGIVARLWRIASTRIASAATRIIVIGRDMQGVMERQLEPRHWRRMRLIPNWSNEASVHPVPKSSNLFIDEMGLRDKIIIQYAGRLGTTHNLEPFVDAAALLTDLPVVIQIVGGGPKAEPLRRRAQRCGLTNIQFLPYQQHDRLGEVLSAADIAVVCLGAAFTGLSVPSKTYGILASGKPVLALLDSSSEIGLLLKEERCGIVLENASSVQIATAIRRLLADPLALQAMSRRARNAFLRSYTLSHATARYDACLTEAFGLDPALPSPT